MPTDHDRIADSAATYLPEFATFYFNPNKIFPYFARFSLLFLYLYDIIIK